MSEKVCNGCETANEQAQDSFAMELLKGYKKQFYVVVAVLSVIIAVLLGIIIYDAYIDSQYETYEYIQDGTGYNNINTNEGTQGDVVNGTEPKSEEGEIVLEP